MSDRTEIQWADSTFNPWMGCTKVGPGCDHCYAERDMDIRYGKVKWGSGNPRVRTSPENWKKPLKWNRTPFAECGDCGWRGELEADGHCGGCRMRIKVKPARRRVFCASLADVFDNEVDPQWQADLFELIRSTPNLDWLLLTKRIGNVRGVLHAATINSRRLPGPWHNVWLGITVVNQEEADRDIPKLLQIPAVVRFLSCEPLLGHIDLRFTNGLVHGYDAADYLVDWVIAGGESGPHSRPSHPDWFRYLRDQCQQSNTSFMFKQWGEWLAGEVYSVKDEKDPEVLHGGFAKHQDGTDGAHGGKPDHWWSGDTFGGVISTRVGKKAAGRMLDGREWSEFPS